MIEFPPSVSAKVAKLKPSLTAGASVFGCKPGNERPTPTLRSKPNVLEERSPQGGSRSASQHSTDLDSFGMCPAPI